MDPERFNTVKRVLVALEDIPVDERAAYLFQQVAVGVHRHLESSDGNNLA